MEHLKKEAMMDAISEVQLNIGLTLVPGNAWLDLYGEGEQLLVRVPMTDDPLGDVDRVRSAWFSGARMMTNDMWD